MVDHSQHIEVPCTLCGQTVTLPKEAYVAGAQVVHEHCAVAPQVMRRFKVKVEIFEKCDDKDDLLTSFADELEAPTFAAAVPLLNTALAALWDRVVEHAPIVDLDA